VIAGQGVCTAAWVPGSRPRMPWGTWPPKMVRWIVNPPWPRPTKALNTPPCELSCEWAATSPFPAQMRSELGGGLNEKLHPACSLSPLKAWQVCPIRLEANVSVSTAYIPHAH